MNCPEVREELELYVLGESGRAAEIQRHLDGCAECTRECGRATATIEMLDRELSLPAPDGIAERVVARVRRRRPKWAMWSVAAAVVAAVAVVALLRPVRLDGIRVTGSHEVVSERRLQWKGGTLRVEVERRGRPAVIETPSGLIEAEEATFEVREMKTTLAIAVLAGAVHLSGYGRFEAGQTAMLGQTEPVKPEPRPEPVKRDVEKPEPPKQEPVKQDPPKEPEVTPKPPAGPTQGMRVAVVDLKRCFDPRKVLWARDMESTLKKFADELEDEIEAVDKRMGELREQMAGLPDKSAPLYLEKFKQFKIAEIEREMVRRLNQSRLQDKKSELATRVYNEIRAVVGILAQLENYDFVLRIEEPTLDDGLSPDAVSTRIANRVVLFAGERYDITSRVIERVNQEYEKKK